MITLAWHFLTEKTPSLDEIKNGIFRTIHTTFVQVHSYFNITIPPQRILEISMLSLSILGMIISYQKKNNAALYLFSTLAGVQVTFISSVSNHDELVSQCAELEIEVKNKEKLNQELINCTEKMKKLSEKLASFQDRFDILKETREDLSKIIDMLVAARSENNELKTQIEKYLRQLETQTNSIGQSAELIEKSVQASNASVDDFKKTAQKLAELTSNLEKLLQTSASIVNK